MPAEVQNEIDRMLARYAPAHVIVDADHRIVRFHGNAGRFFELSPGGTSFDLLSMAREGLVQPLKTSLRSASKRGAAVHRRNIRVRTNTGFERLDVEVAPLPIAGGKAWFIVVFESRAGAEPIHAGGDNGSQATKGASGHRAQMNKLRNELEQTRDSLRMSIEQQETTNDELRSANEAVQSTNEELQSINEELESSREQLQSSNDELMSVNQELLNRSMQLALLNSELNDMLGSLQLAIVIVDRDIRIKRFTPGAETILNLLSTDVDRPLAELTLNIACPELAGHLRQVVASGVAKRLEVSGKGGARYCVRLRPYVSEANAIEGAAIVTVDTL